MYWKSGLSGKQKDSKQSKLCCSHFMKSFLQVFFAMS